MEGFENSTDLNRFMDYLTKSKQLTIFKNMTSLMRKYFSKCDYYFADMNTETNRKFLSVGSKNVGAQTNTRCTYFESRCC